jgi:hypothetical protein
LFGIGGIRVGEDASFPRDVILVFVFAENKKQS